MRELLAICEPVSFSWTLLHGVSI